MLIMNPANISRSTSQIPQATQHDLIFQRFSCPPIVPADEKDEGMWYVVNKNMDSLFGVENCKENIKCGKFGIEVVVNYLKEAREHSSWNADELLAIKLERIFKCFEGMFPQYYRIILHNRSFVFYFMDKIPVEYLPKNHFKSFLSTIKSSQSISPKISRNYLRRV
jgi:hypothetical protein